MASVGILLCLSVSSRGALFSYGSLMGVATASATLTLPALQGDMTWNHVRFNARLLHAWWKSPHGGSAPEFLDPGRIGDFSASRKVRPWQAVDLTQLSSPQPLLLRSFEHRATRLDRALRVFCAICLMGGLALFARTGRTARLKADRGGR
jgi:hypothetical protein